MFIFQEGMKLSAAGFLEQTCELNIYFWVTPERVHVGYVKAAFNLPAY